MLSLTVSPSEDATANRVEDPNVSIEIHVDPKLPEGLQRGSEARIGPHDEGVQEVLGGRDFWNTLGGPPTRQVLFWVCDRLPVSR